MRGFASTLACAALLMGCGPSATSEQKAEFAGNLLTATTAPAAQKVTVATSTYVVEPNAARTMAFVTPIAGLQHNIDRMEQAAAQFTDCDATARPEVYAMMSGKKFVAIPT